MSMNIAASVVNRWRADFNNHDAHTLVENYTSCVSLIPTFRSENIKSKSAALKYFRDLFSLGCLHVPEIEDMHVSCLNKEYCLICGLYKFVDSDKEVVHLARFTFLVNTATRKIIHHHSSIVPGVEG